MMAVSAATLPTGAEWSYEVKWDGYRAQGVKNGTAVSLASRNLSWAPAVPHYNKKV